MLLAPNKVGVTLWYLEALIGVNLVLPIFSYALRGAGEMKVQLAWLMAALGLLMPIATASLQINRVYAGVLGTHRGVCGLLLPGYAPANTEFSRGAWSSMCWVLPVRHAYSGGSVPVLNHQGLGGLATEYPSVPTIFWASAVFFVFVSPLNRLPEGGSDGSALNSRL